MKYAHPFHTDDDNVLSHIAIKYGSDKYYEGYTKYYNSTFKDIKDKKVNLLEIGVLKGSSIHMWEEYFVNGDIIGIDINPECKKFEEEKIKIFIGNQTDSNFFK